jgi:hypothetical protein
MRFFVTPLWYTQKQTSSDLTISELYRYLLYPSAANLKPRVYDIFSMRVSSSIIFLLLVFGMLIAGCTQPQQPQTQPFLKPLLLLQELNHRL